MTIDKVGSNFNHSSDIQPRQVQARERVSFSLKDKRDHLPPGRNIEEYKEPNKEAVEQAIDNLNNFLEPVRRNLKFELHDKLEKYYVTVVDSTTDEVIKEIPPKQILDMYAEMAEFMGLLVDRKI